MTRIGIAGIGFVAAFQCSLAFSGELLSGHPVILDGDTLRLRGNVVGLYGIAAPGLGQKCEGRTGQSIACGANAADALAERIGQANIACEPRGTDRHRRMLAICRLAGEDLSAWMVTNGLAVADRLVANDYVAHDKQAWAKRRGLWAGVFEDPSDRLREDYLASVKISTLGK